VDIQRESIAGQHSTELGIQSEVMLSHFAQLPGIWRRLTPKSGHRMEASGGIA
jgi:hypothetical protein